MTEMTNEEIKQEFGRWIDANRPSVWIYSIRYGIWEKIPQPVWVEGNIYVVNDQWSKLRRAEAEGRQLQRYDEMSKRYIDCSGINENIGIQNYKVKG